MLLLALGIPLTINLQRRATGELETQALIQAQGIAALVDEETFSDPDRLDQIVRETSAQVGGRVLVVDRRGSLLADSDGPASLGLDYATRGRPELEAALTGVPTSDIRRSEDLGQDIMATAVPIQDQGRILGAVRITKTVQAVKDNVRRVTYGLAAIGLAALGAGLLLAFGLAGSLSRPLSRLADAAKRLGAGDLTTRAGSVRGAREIEDLGRSFDEMAGRLERSVHAQREFVANASHQLRTPLTAMKLRLEGVIAGSREPEVRERLEAADREVDRLSGIVDRLLVMARQIEEGTSSTVDVGEAVTRAMARWDERARQLDASLLSSGEGGTARADPTDLDQILDNLIDNAIAYAPGEISIESTEVDGGVVVVVQDHGPGIPAADLPQVTDRFYRGTKAPSGGSGLGLAIARQLAEKWGGTIEVSSTEGSGTRVELQLQQAT